MRRYPRLQVRAELRVSWRGQSSQVLEFAGSARDLKAYGLASDELLEWRGDGRRRHPEDGLGNAVSAGWGSRDEGTAYALHWVQPEDDRPVPKWAEQAAARILRRLARQ